jgi:elongation factor Ts
METTERFTAKDVMALRQKTGLGMMDCKRALAECNGDPAAAEEWLRHKMRGKMSQRTERATGEGLIAVEIDGPRAAVIELRSETDFTARSDEFTSMVRDVCRLALDRPAGPIEPSDQMARRIEDVRIQTGENVRFGRGEKLEGGRFACYVHHDRKRAALLQYQGSSSPEVLTGVCQHIVAHDPAPIGIDEKDVPAAQVEKVRAEAIQEAQDSGKPLEIAKKMAEGRVRKYLEEKTLLNQPYVKDPSGKTSVRKALGDTLTVVRFVRYTVGAE